MTRGASSCRSASTHASSAAGELDTLLQQQTDLAPSRQHEDVTTYPLLPQYFYEVRERPIHYMTRGERTRYRLGVSNGQLVAADGSVLGSSAELVTPFSPKSPGVGVMVGVSTPRNS